MPAKKQWKAVQSKLSVTKALKLLKKHYPDAHCALDHETPFQLLIATILSAQCTDERVNQVTKVLFAQFPDALSLSAADIAVIEKIVRPTGFFKNKSKNLKLCSQSLVQEFSGEVPRTMDELVDLAGVGRKTANVVLGNAFGIASGVVVDTHVTRLSNRFGWTKSVDPVAIEAELCKLVPKSDWILISHLLISHGRAICKARRPLCDQCFLADHCPSRL